MKKFVAQYALATIFLMNSFASDAQRLEEITVIGVVPAGSSVDATKLAVSYTHLTLPTILLV